MSFSNIHAAEISIGVGAVIDPTAQIRGLHGKAQRIVIGDYAYIGADVQIICDDFSLGDYSKMHHHTNVHGYLPCFIGHNAWIGQYSLLDSIGGLTIGNNCGIGAHSQLWSHIKFGDMLEGCYFLGEKPLWIGDDVWFVGHCLISPIRAENKSMAMAGSVVTKDMAYNTVYAGTPAKPISDKVGPQFREVSVAEKMDKMRLYLAQSGVETAMIRLVETIEEIVWDDPYSYFAVATRQYKKMRSAAEVAFMRYLLPEKAKFVPYLPT